jgi:membrane associated rhomboid family serine protease
MSDDQPGGDTELSRFAQWRPSVRRSSFIGRFWRSIQWRNWPVSILLFVCIGVFISQVLIPLPIERWGLSSAALRQGHYETLLTNIVMHGGLMHLLSNMVAYLAVAPLVCARFGRGMTGTISYHAFFLLCGLAGDLLFLALHRSGEVPVVGASGAIYGLFAAAFRLDSKSDHLRAHLSRRVLSGWRWMVISNIIVVLMFGGPQILLQILQGNFTSLTVPIAWEAHVGGFLAGIFLMDVMANKGWQDDWRGGFVDPEQLEESSRS